MTMEKSVKSQAAELQFNSIHDGDELEKYKKIATWAISKAMEAVNKVKTLELELACFRPNLKPPNVKSKPTSAIDCEGNAKDQQIPPQRFRTRNRHTIICREPTVGIGFSKIGQIKILEEALKESPRKFGIIEWTFLGATMEFVTTKKNPLKVVSRLQQVMPDLRWKLKTPKKRKAMPKQIPETKSTRAPLVSSQHDTQLAAGSLSKSVKPPRTELLERLIDNNMPAKINSSCDTDSDFEIIETRPEEIIISD